MFAFVFKERLKGHGNYHALNDLFKISQSRKGNINYEVGVQTIEIYNEQVLDLLSDDSSQKKYHFVSTSSYILFLSSLLVVYLFTLTLHTLGIMSTTSQNGSVVPDANMYPVTLTSDVITLTYIGLHNRYVGASAMNEVGSNIMFITMHKVSKILEVV